MPGKRIIIFVVVLLSLVVALPVLAAAPSEGTVYEGQSVPGITLGDTRAEVEFNIGPPRGCVSNNDPPTMESCSFDVDGGGWVSVFYQGKDGGTAAGAAGGSGAGVLQRHDPAGDLGADGDSARDGQDKNAVGDEEAA